MKANESTRTSGPFASNALSQSPESSAVLESSTPIEYTVHELARISNASIRTLRYYEEQGLLAPRRRENGYRVYGLADVRRLQQILLYGQADMPLAQIRGILNAPANETGTGRTISDDAARFEAFKQPAIRENERVYGTEVRARYGDAVADASNAKMTGMTEGQWAEAESQQRDVEARLSMIAASDSPEDEVLGEAGRRLFELHRAWLMHYWTPAMYSPATHRWMSAPIECPKAQGRPPQTRSERPWRIQPKTIGLFGKSSTAALTLATPRASRARCLPGRVPRRSPRGWRSSS